MDPLPHILSQVLAAQPFMPPAVINDDDVHLVDLRTLRSLACFGSSSSTAEELRRGGLPARLGQGWLKGMQLRHMQGARDEH